MKRLIVYGLAGGFLIAVLKVLEYKHFVRAYPSEIYGGLVAVIFLALGIYAGLRWDSSRRTVVAEAQLATNPPVTKIPLATQEAGVGSSDEAEVEPGRAIDASRVKELDARGVDARGVDASRVKELGITPRELEILGLIAEGFSNREIGERLFVSENTVKTHSSRLFEKLEVNRRVQAVRRARELGLVP